MIQDYLQEKPIVFFDLETTGVNPVQDRIVQIAYIKIYPDGKKEQDKFLIDPLVPIPKSATEVHGITDEMVKTANPFRSMAIYWQKVFDDVIYAGYNLIRFDFPMLMQEFARCKIYLDWQNAILIDPFQIIVKMYPRNLEAAYKIYCNGEIENAHDAMADTKACLEIFDEQLKRHDLGRTMSDVMNFTIDKETMVDISGKLKRTEKGITYTFGKWKDLPVMLNGETKGYANWMLKNDFPIDTKQCLNAILKGKLK